MQPSASRPAIAFPRRFSSASQRATATLTAAFFLATAAFFAPPRPVVRAESSPAVPATTQALPNYTTTHEMRMETQSLVAFLENVHLVKKPVKNLDANGIVKEYIGALDYTRLFFDANEVKNYQLRFAPLLEVYFVRGNLAPAFTIYQDFYTRVEKRVDWINRRLDQPFDLNTDETFVADRHKADWPANSTEADQLWERRLKLDLILELLSDEKKIAKAAAKTSEKKPATTEATEATPPTAAASLTDATERVRKRYNKIKTYLRFEPYEVQEIYLNTLAAQYDPHTTFFTRQSREDFEIAMRNKLIGVGAVLRDEDGYCVVKELLAGGPIENDKRIRVGDRIIAIGQGDTGDLSDVVGMRLNKIVSQLRGKEGTTVRLRIEPAADRANRYIVALKRAEIKLTTKLAQATLFEIPSPDGKGTIPLGLIDLPAFYGKSGDDGDTFSTTDDVAELITKLKQHNIQGLVIDLRRNGGGLLDEAIRLTGLFIPPGQPVVQVRDIQGKTDHGDTPENKKGPLWDGPLVLLVSKLSASASEIVAGALQDHHRAIVVGDDHTHGKGSVQTIVNNSRFNPDLGSAIKFTIQKWYLPGGNSIQLKGVEADVPAPSIYSVLPVSESDLEHPLEWDTIKTALADTPATDLPPKAIVSPELAKALREASAKRQSGLPEFANLNRVVTWTKSREKSRAYPVNYKTLKTESETDRAFSASIRDTYKKLSVEKFKSENIKLNAAIEQEKKDAAMKAERQETDDATEKKDPAAAGTGTATDPASASAPVSPSPTPPAATADPVKKAEKKNSAQVPPKKLNKPIGIGSHSSDDDDDEEDEPVDFDVQQRESLRVLSDWISRLTPIPALAVVPVLSAPAADVIPAAAK